jgi:hypothetical protein
VRAEWGKKKRSDETTKDEEEYTQPDEEKDDSEAEGSSVRNESSPFTFANERVKARRLGERSP